MRARRLSIIITALVVATAFAAAVDSPSAGAATGSNYTYTLDADFAEGTLVNVNYTDVPNQLQLDSEATPFNFIWIAASSRGTVIKIDTTTGDILGEFRSTPLSQGWGNPSRTTVDNDGSVWVANRNDVYDGFGSVLHIGLLENNQCEDRNGNGVIDTSTGLSDILAWTDTTGARGVATAADECIVHYTQVNSRGTRHVSVDANNDVWVGGLNLANFDLVEGGKYDVPSSGTIIRSETSVGFGGYGGLIDGNGVIWSAGVFFGRNLLRWDTANPLNGPNGDPAGLSIGPPVLGRNWSGQFGDSYGLCIDSQGNVWNTQLSGDGIRKYAPDGSLLGAFAHGNENAQGCVVDGNDHVWVAHSLFNATTIGHLLNDGTYIGNVSLAGGNGPTGVAVDAQGKIWAANINSSTASRIDPTLGVAGAVDLTVDLGAGAGPYNYSDMTGSTLIEPPNNGTWTITHDCGFEAEFGSVSWNADEPSDSSISVTAASAVAEGDPFSGAVAAVNGADLTIPDGQFLRAVVSFARSSDGDSPVLYDFTVNCKVADVDKWWNYTNVCFERDNDGDGYISEDWVDFDDLGLPIDNDGDGYFNEDGPECDPAYLGTPLNMEGDNYTVDAVVGKNGRVKNYNPGQVYAATRIEALVDGTFTITEDYSACVADVLELNPTKGGGRLVVVRDNGGTPEQILDAKDIEALGGIVGPAMAMFDIDMLAGDVIYVYVKFRPNDADIGSMCLNETTASTLGGSNFAGAVLEVIEK